MQDILHPDSRLVRLGLMWAVMTAAPFWSLGDPRCLAIAWLDISILVMCFLVSVPLNLSQGMGLMAPVVR